MNINVEYVLNNSKSFTNNIVKIANKINETEKEIISLRAEIGKSYNFNDTDINKDVDVVISKFYENKQKQKERLSILTDFINGLLNRFNSLYEAELTAVIDDHKYKEVKHRQKNIEPILSKIETVKNELAALQSELAKQNDIRDNMANLYSLLIDRLTNFRATGRRFEYQAVEIIPNDNYKLIEENRSKLISGLDFKNNLNILKGIDTDFTDMQRELTTS